MSRQQFSSSNNIGKVVTFQKSGSTSSFDPIITFPSDSRRVSWRFDNGSGTTQVAGNAITYTGFTYDSGIRTIQARVNSFNGVSQLLLDNDNIYGHLDLTLFTNISGSLYVNSNAYLTGVTHPYSSQAISVYHAYQCNLIGELDLTPFSNFGGFFRAESNPNLTGISHSPSTSSISQYLINNCNLTGDLDLSMLSGLGGSFNASFNSNLTNIIHAPSLNTFSTYYANVCNLTDNLDLSMLPGLGGNFGVFLNTNLTGITHTYSSNNFSSYSVYNCNLIGNLDLSMLPGLGGQFNVSTNPNLTGITHTASTNVFYDYSVTACNLIGNHDISMLQNLGGQVTVALNPLLTGFTFTSASTESLRSMAINQCNIQGVLDLTPFNGFGGTYSGASSNIKINGNSGLTDVVFPLSDGFYFSNIANDLNNAAFGLYSAGLGYVDFKPLSGSTLISGATQGIPRFELYGNGMTTAEVNHILSDLDLISSLNYSGWTATSGTTGARVDITSNSAPDGSSGGYNGTGATISLVSKGWIIFTD